jgi:hypothetical protein
MVLPAGGPASRGDVHHCPTSADGAQGLIPRTPPAELAASSSSSYAPGVQLVDLLVDGAVRNVRQRSDNPALLSRLNRAVQTAGRVEVRRAAATPPAPTPAGRLDALLHNVVFVAEVDDDAIAGYEATAAKWSLAVTADHAYRSPSYSKLIAKAKDLHRPVHPWCDCREPDGDPPGTPFRDAVADGARARPRRADRRGGIVGRVRPRDRRRRPAVIGNPNALDQARRDLATSRIGAGTLAFTGEELDPNPNYSAAGVPIASVTIYVGPGGGVYQPCRRVRAGAVAGAARDVLRVPRRRAPAGGLVPAPVAASSSSSSSPACTSPASALLSRPWPSSSTTAGA